MSTQVQFISLCIALTVSAMGWAEEPLRSSVSFPDAEKVIAERNRIGEQLKLVLADLESPVKVRLEAARLLGELQYMPAIEQLIQHIELSKPDGIISFSNPSNDYPLVPSLGMYGTSAVPQMVDAYLAERNQQIQTLIFFAIRTGKTTAIARQYLLGIDPPKEEDWLRKQNYNHLKKLLNETLQRK